MTIGIFSLFTWGFLLGLQHATDPDHIAAVANYITRSRHIQHAGFIGMLWGLGHATTLIIVGTTLLLLKISFPEEFLIYIERTIGVIILILGIRLLYRLWRDDIHVHSHTHGAASHTHLHANDKHRHKLSFLTGLLHGLAGSGTLALLTVSSAQTIIEGLGFMMIFGIGATIGMFVFSLCIGTPLLYLQKGGYVRLERLLLLLIGVVSLAIGMRIVIS